MSKDKVIIKGVAVREGTSRNRRKYIAKELLKFAPTLIGRPILKDHDGITDNVIGKITEAFSNDEGKTVEYVGWVKEDGTGLLEKFKDGRISEVSIGAIAGKIVKEKKDDDVIIPIDMEALELSTTPVPGNKGTSITMENNNYTKEKIKEMIKEFTNNTFNKNRKEDNKMTNENDNVNENMKLEIQNLKEKLEATNKVNEGLEKEKTKLEEQRRLDAIEKYKGICEAKKVEAKDMTKSNMEMIKFATEMVDGLPEPKEEESDEDNKSSEEDKPKKKEAESESEDPKKGDEDKDESKESFEGYVISDSDVVGGVALFKTY